MNITNITSKDCLSCKGNGKVFIKGFTSLEGKVYQDRTDPCLSCKGTGMFFPPNEAKILERINATKGKNKGKLRASMTSNFQDKEEARAYYVWRLARFHGGVDMTMPMSADLGVRGDPFKDVLDKLADEVAKANFGTDLAAAHAWGRALGF